jgi:integrase
MSTRSKIRELIKGKKYELTIEAGKSPVTGRRQRIVRRVTGRLRDAEDLRDEIVNQLKYGTYIDPHRTTLSEYLTEWLKNHETNLAPTTYATYKAIIEGHITPAIGGVSLTDLKAMRIQQYYTEKLSELSPRSVQQHHAILHAALKQAVKWQLIAFNPVVNVTPPKPELKSTRTLTLQESQTLFAEMTGHDLEPLFTLLAETGMRLGEVLALRWEDIHLPIIWIRQSVSRVNKVDHFKPPKSGKARQIVLTDKALEVFNGLDKGDGLVFNDNGNPLRPSNISRLFKRLAKKAGFDMRLHDLRHTHATQLLELGINPRVVQERLGHHEVAFTLGRYTHVVEGMQSDAVDTFNKKRVNVKMADIWQTLTPEQQKELIDKLGDTDKIRLN